MAFTNTTELKFIVDSSIDSVARTWLKDKLETIIETLSAKELYLTYSLLASKVNTDNQLEIKGIGNSELKNYLSTHDANALQVSRMYLLSKVLNENEEYFRPKVVNLIQVADTGEMETFLKFLILLPNPENYKQAAVEALRTNIATVFDAISADNPYPAKYFNDQQWNQMYLKAAFMQQDLSRIQDVDDRANADLARIISDYAHERWAASRDVDPLFWRPVGAFLKGDLLKDMMRLLQSDDPSENRAGALCCFQSDNPEAKALLEKHPELRKKVADGTITWSKITN
ncbi:MAG: EboA domain-containing protein [Pricia sp.]